MSLLFSATLLIGALLTFWFVLRKIRKAEVTIADSTFWFLFALSLVLIIESPANFVFVYVIAVLVLREFYTTIEMSQLRAKVRNLVQNQALATVRQADEKGKVHSES